MKYDISHLTQETDVVFGPIQDDEALFLYSLIKICGIKYIIEVGGLHGYSSLNFLQALADEGRLITVDPNFTDQNKLLQKSNFTLISKNIQDVDVCQIPVPRIDCIFFDCHDVEVEYEFLIKAISCGLVSDNTIVIIHDTGTHPDTEIPYPGQIFLNDKSLNGNYGFSNKALMKDMELVNKIIEELGYSALHLHINNLDLPKGVSFRHGLTILNKTKKLLISYESRE